MEKSDDIDFSKVSANFQFICSEFCLCHSDRESLLVNIDNTNKLFRFITLVALKSLNI